MGCEGKKTEEPKKMNLRWWFTDACHAIELHYHKLRSKNSEKHLCLHPNGCSLHNQQDLNNFLVFQDRGSIFMDIHSTLFRLAFCLRRNQNFFVFNACLLSSALKFKPGGHDVLTNRIPNQKLVYSKKITSTLSFTR